MFLTDTVIDDNCESGWTSESFKGLKLEAFDVEAVQIPTSGGQMKFQIEDFGMEPEASEQHGLPTSSGLVLSFFFLVLGF